LAGRIRRGRLLAFGAVTAAMACSVLPVSAHTTHEGSETLFKGVSGPYELLVTVVPLVGFLEVTVVIDPVTDEASGGRDYAPRIVVLASREGEQTAPEAAQQGLMPMNEYVAVLKPGAPGRWDIVINIDSELGPSSLTLPVQVRESGRGFPWTALIAGLGIVLPILWLVFAPRKRRRAP
jgi:hypothetical protein